MPLFVIKQADKKEEEGGGGEEKEKKKENEILNTKKMSFLYISVTQNYSHLGKKHTLAHSVRETFWNRSETISKAIALACFSCYNKVPQRRWVITKIYFSLYSRLGSLRSGYQYGLTGIALLVISGLYILCEKDCSENTWKQLL